MAQFRLRPVYATLGILALIILCLGGVIYSFVLDNLVVYKAENGDASAVQSLLARGANPNASDPKLNMTALDFAVQSGNLATVKALLNKGAEVNSVNQKGSSVLMSAAGGMNTSIVQALLDKGADVNAQDVDGQTALMYAVAVGNVANIKFLLSKGADTDIKDTNGQTALSLAVKSKRQDIAFLIRKAVVKK